MDEKQGIKRKYVELKEKSKTEFCLGLPAGKILNVKRRIEREKRNGKKERFSLVILINLL
jgi:uncharacterized membrane protein